MILIIMARQQTRIRCAFIVMPRDGSVQKILLPIEQGVFVIKYQ